MGGGILQLAAQGAQDVYLTGSPQITFWKVVYKRYTNFAVESVEQTFDNDLDFGKNKLVTTISRSGDLIHKVWLQVNLGNPNVDNLGQSLTSESKRYTLTNSTKNLEDFGYTRTITRVGDSNSWKIEDEDSSVEYTFTENIPNGINELVKTSGNDYWEINPLFRWAKNIGFLLINSIEIEIGGMKIDKHYGEWLHFMWKYAYPNSKTEMSGGPLLGEDENINEETVLFIPLQFWFCRNPGLSIPIIALQYHEIKLVLETRPLSQLVVRPETEHNRVMKTVHDYSGKPTISGNFWVDYIYLDADERRRFAQISHEYLIEQVKTVGTNSADLINISGETTIKQKLNFNHPVKELVWTLSEEDDQLVDFDEFFSYGYSNSGYNGNSIYLKTAKLILNGTDRVRERDEKYFRIVQPFQHHTKIPQNANNVFMYSFSLKPEEHQPSGTCNFSRIDTADLLLTLHSTKNLVLKVHAWNYNVLKIASGMAGLAFSN